MNSDFFSACNQMAGLVESSISSLVCTHEGGRTVRMGADGTPTKLIDQVAEDSIMEYLRENPLCSLLISEEAGKVAFDGPEGTLFLDPVDGTFNAVAGIPFYALSLAYATEGIVRKAYVRNLSSGETFTAEKGKFAQCNGKDIRVSTVANLDECALSVYGRKFDPTRVFHLGQKIRRWRLLGASALELCYVGCGRIDGFIDLRGTLRVTDAAAGMLVCSEAGGKVSDMDGRNLSFPEEVTVGRCIVATNGVLHHKVIEYLR
ncbi:bifunctional fructose-bisphosphatase/inositol-phosphate phosphatase [Methanoregula formicica]|uniref:fructose-bisphosphatase n=1 Tax=Methanoregula formicica (strain DSM 22288 / NBRC 105244 / SMSP) TaxID=593750 RepID=L0HCS4_METFS|nr:bifunctional fructose-bisphosphatase/inositol-phosphate phosphatase [Methanoregula formicica]AGB02537.1 inositol monophosphatase/fructose-1,6-bisphosphatase family protein [Methanoregula formicica SMSP]